MSRQIISCHVPPNQVPSKPFCLVQSNHVLACPVKSCLLQNSQPSAAKINEAMHRKSRNLLNIDINNFDNSSNTSTTTQPNSTKREGKAINDESRYAVS